MPDVQRFASELAISARDPEVWLCVAVALIASAVIGALGILVVRGVGLVEPHAPATETFGVGLAAGMVVVATMLAAVGSGGRSAFTPVAVGFVIAIALALTPEARRARAVVSAAARSPDQDRIRPRVVVWLLGAAFIVIAVFVFSATMALSPRDGLQPIEFMDEAFYSSLAGDLAKTGTESLFSSSGFVDVPGLPVQTWYHWGELWLASAFIKFVGIAPIAARHFIVLPILLLSLAAIVGTLVQRLNRTASAWAYALGVVVVAVLAPIPRLSGPWFSHWAVGQVFGITLYGLAAVGVALSLFAVLASPGARTWRMSGFVGSIFAFLLPAHFVLAGLAVAGLSSVITLRVLRRIRSADAPSPIPEPWRRAGIWTATLVVVTGAWGLATGHGIGASASSPGVAAFNETWRDSVIAVVFGAGALLSVPIAWVAGRRRPSAPADFYLGVGVIVAFACVAWGARLADFNMFHVFFGALAVFATPAAAMATWTVWTSVRSRPRPALAIVVAVIVVVQLGVGALTTLERLQAFGPGTYAAVPIRLLDQIKRLPSDARIAYACALNEEVSYWDARLLGIGVHTDRRIVPICFEADFFATMIGGKPTLDMSPLFVTAPHRAIYPDANAMPSPDVITNFFHTHGIGYIYADGLHPNVLIPDAEVIARIDQFQLFRVP